MWIFRDRGDVNPLSPPLDPRIHTGYEGMKIESIVGKKIELCVFNEKFSVGVITSLIFCLRKKACGVFSPGICSFSVSVDVDPPLPLLEDVSLPLTQRLPEQEYPLVQELHGVPDTYGLSPL